MIFADLSISLEGFVAGPNPTQEDPLGTGGEQLHEWAIADFKWREAHGHAGGEKSVDSDVIGETIARAGAGVMGRKMYSGGSGGWENDPNPRGWWGDDPPFHHSVFVLTHHEREPLEMEGGTTFYFVTDGIEAALDQARAAAGDKDVLIAGGAEAAQQYLKAGLVDEVQLHIAPVFLGAGERLFDDHVGDAPRQVTVTSVIEGPTGATHVAYSLAT